MAFDVTRATPGSVVLNEARSRLTFIAHVPKAKPEQRVICLHDGDIVTFNSDGQFFGPHKPSKMDLVN